jgi:integrase
VISSGKALTPLQWNYVIETAEVMAAKDPRHERTLFIVATLFSLYLRISDLVVRDNWQPTMGSFEFDGENWWFNVVGKGNKAAKVSVREEYIEDYLKRYRTTLSLPPLPSHKECTPLVKTIRGRAGLSGRHIRALIQLVFDRSLQRMKDEGQSDLDMDILRSASLHWLRHTAATFDAPLRDIKDLQADLRHESMSTTQNTYYNSLDQKRAKSVKGLGIGTNADAWREENSSRLRLGLCHQSVLRSGGGRLRLQPEPCWRTCLKFPRPLEREAGLRCLRWLQGRL